MVYRVHWGDGRALVQSMTTDQNWVEFALRYVIDYNVRRTLAVDHRSLYCDGQ